VAGKYVGPVQLRLSGDENLASRYIGPARVIVQEMMEEMDAFGTKDRIRRELQTDGTHITVRVMEFVERAPLIQVYIDSPIPEEPQPEEPEETEEPKLPPDIMQKRIRSGLFIIGYPYYLEPNPDIELDGQEYGAAGTWRLASTVEGTRNGNSVQPLPFGLYYNGVVTSYGAVMAYMAEEGTQPYAFVMYPPEDFEVESAIPYGPDNGAIHLLGPEDTTAAIFFWFAGSKLVGYDPGSQTYYTFEGYDSGEYEWGSSTVESEGAAFTLAASTNATFNLEGTEGSSYTGRLFDAGYSYLGGYTEWTFGASAEAELLEFEPPEWGGWGPPVEEGDLEAIRYFLSYGVSMCGGIPTGLPWCDDCNFIDTGGIPREDSYSPEGILYRVCWYQNIDKKTATQGANWGIDSTPGVIREGRGASAEMVWRDALRSRAERKEEREWVATGYWSNYWGYCSTDTRTILGSELINSVYVIDIDCDGWIVDHTRLTVSDHDDSSWTVTNTVNDVLRHQWQEVVTRATDEVWECVPGNYTNEVRGFIWRSGFKEGFAPTIHLNPGLLGEVTRTSVQRGSGYNIRTFACIPAVRMYGEVVATYDAQNGGRACCGTVTDVRYTCNGILMDGTLAAEFFLRYVEPTLGFEPLFFMSGQTYDEEDGTPLPGSVWTHALGGCLLSAVTDDDCCVFATYAVRTRGRDLAGGVPYTIFDDPQYEELQPDPMGGPQHETFEVWGVYNGSVTNLTSLIAGEDGLMDVLRLIAVANEGWTGGIGTHQRLVMPATRKTASEVPGVLFFNPTHIPR
jgi:hypothetical protein